jgi:sec-independent protein translocase protein TatC
MSPAAAPAPTPAPDPALEPAEPEHEVKLTFWDHLRELRKRLVLALYGVLAGMIAIGYFVERLFHELMKPVIATLPEGHQQIYFTSYIEPMMVYIKVAIYGGVFVSAPWMLFQVWQFIAPGLYKRERRVVVPFLFFGTLLFYLGGAFCYWLVMPQAFPAMAAIAADASLAPMLTMSEQLSLVLAMILGFGIVFEVPVIIAFLSLVGLVTAEGLAKYRRYAIIGNVIAAAIITPTGDPINLAIMAVPMVLFYEIGILLARILGKKKPADEAITPV